MARKEVEKEVGGSETVASWTWKRMRTEYQCAVATQKWEPRVGGSFVSLVPTSLVVTSVNIVSMHECKCLMCTNVVGTNPNEVRT